MTYRIQGLDPAGFAHLLGASDRTLARYHAVRVTADIKPGAPCRVTLEDAEPGETLILVNHTSHEGGPYHASHAIFVRDSATEAAVYENDVPPVFATRTLSMRAFDAGGMMSDAALAAPGEADATIRRLFANPAIDHIDVHNATRGCFAARVTRS
ncbi:MAG TPA: DUF1203 domain-containing protein [Sphingomonas sp.]|nr:DUF1203 domain-containing protein [Sphingomonas sp.]